MHMNGLVENVFTDGRTTSRRDQLTVIEASGLDWRWPDGEICDLPQRARAFRLSLHHLTRLLGRWSQNLSKTVCATRRACC